MRSPIRRGLFAGVALLALAFVATQHLSSAQAYEQPADEAQPQTMEQFLTAVTKDVDAYWTTVVRGRRAAGAAGQLRVDPGRPDRRERVRR